MARCEDIRLLLGPFEDGELEPHEMQEVARHVVGCSACESELADYRTLAVSLRGAAAMPDLGGFTEAVVARIEKLPLPIGLRFRRYLTSFTDGIGATIAAGLATAAVAVLTATVLTPYFRQNLSASQSQRPPEIARNAQPSTEVNEDVASNNVSPGIPADIASSLSTDVTGSGIAPVNDLSGNSENSRTIISRLEADSPSVAVWSEPQTDTTVIWVPDQQQ
jgi:anti-sigma factor RsiW